MLSQQATTGSAPMEEIKRTNTVVVRRQEQGMGALRRDHYVIEMNRERNCYVCGGFWHMAHHCRNWGQRGRVAERRRLGYGGERIEGNYEQSSHLK